MIIGINGKIGSGKDTVGKIIQWLTKPELDGQYIGFQTYDDVTLERLSPFKIKKFAGKLKQIASLLTGIPVEMFEDQEFKKTYLSDEWSTVNGLSTRHKVRKDMTVRDLLQKLGTEAMRNGLHTNVWVNALFAQYKVVDKKYKHCPECNKEQPEFLTTCPKCHPVRLVYDKVLPNWIISDLRYPNEKKRVETLGGVCIRIERPGIDTVDHPSETSLDHSNFRFTIYNSGTVEQLEESLLSIYNKLK